MNWSVTIVLGLGKPKTLGYTGASGFLRRSRVFTLSIDSVSAFYNLGQYVIYANSDLNVVSSKPSACASSIAF